MASIAAVRLALADVLPIEATTGCRRTYGQSGWEVRVRPDLWIPRSRLCDTSDVSNMYLASAARELAWLLALVALGSAAIVVPTLVMNGVPTPEKGDGPYWWPWWIVFRGYDDAMNGATTIAVAAALVALGFLAGRFSGRHGWIRGAYLTAMLPFGSLVDAILHGDHNLLGIEWFFYGLVSLVPLVGSNLGAMMAKRRLTDDSTPAT